MYYFHTHYYWFLIHKFCMKRLEINCSQRSLNVFRSFISSSVTASSLASSFLELPRNFFLGMFGFWSMLRVLQKKILFFFLYAFFSLFLLDLPLPLSGLSKSNDADKDFLQFWDMNIALCWSGIPGPSPKHDFKEGLLRLSRINWFRSLFRKFPRI